MKIESFNQKIWNFKVWWKFSISDFLLKLGCVQKQQPPLFCIGNPRNRTTRITWFFVCLFVCLYVFVSFYQIRKKIESYFRRSVQRNVFVTTRASDVLNVSRLWQQIQNLFFSTNFKVSYLLTEWFDLHSVFCVMLRKLTAFNIKEDIIRFVNLFSSKSKLTLHNMGYSRTKSRLENKWIRRDVNDPDTVLNNLIPLL